MKVQFEITKEELKNCFGDNFNHTMPLEVKLGSETFTCHIYEMSSCMEGWRHPLHIYSIGAEGNSKRLQEIADAKALVNKTKEAHKEAQRKLAELQEGK